MRKTYVFRNFDSEPVTVEQRKRALERIARLGEAEERGFDPDVAAVREEIEGDLGGTVSRNLAAGFLGVSHTALNRWVDSGDIPVVITAAGRREVPIPPLIDLQRSAQAEKRAGRRRRHVLEPSMAEARERAARLDPGLSPGMSRAGPHRLADLRGLAYHRALAPQLRRPMVDRARVKLDRWEAEGRIDARYAGPWRELLGRPLPEIRAAISADDERGRELRQSSPLAGLLSEPERRKVLEAVRADA